MAKIKKVSAARLDLLKQYKRERTRIQRRVRAYQKQGLEFVNLLPGIPKKVTAASVRRLKKINLEAIRRAARYIDPATGEDLGYYGKKYRDERIRKEQAERRKREELEFTADTIINTFLEYVQERADQATTNVGYYDALKGVEIVKKWVQTYIATYGKVDLAKKLERAKNDGYGISTLDLYDVGYTYYALGSMGLDMGLSEDEAEDLEKKMSGGADEWWVPEDIAAPNWERMEGRLPKK